MLSEQAVILLLFASLASSQTVITFSLNKTTTLLDKELFNNFINISALSTIQLDITDVNDNVSFIIFQVHSHIYNVTVSNNSNMDNSIKGYYVTGNNVGLYSSTKPKVDIFYIKNPNAFDLSLLVSVYGYGEKDPIPGGCNMEFPMPISPFMRTTYFKNYIFVDAAPARYYKDPDCLNITNVHVEFYLMYLPEKRYDAETYYNGIRNMMSLEKIIKNSYAIPKTSWTMRRMLSAYSGTGTVYVAVAKDISKPEYYSVYVPTHNYACTSPDDDNDCEILEDILSKFICAALLFVGLFMCYFGHRFFKTEMFLFGMLSGVLITYIVISIMADLDKSALLSASVLSGVFFGGIWVTFWWFYGIPIIAVTLPALNLGFLLSAIMYNRLPGDILLIQENFNFWTLFLLVTTLSSMILVSMTFVSNILCCAVLGAYAVIYPIDFYLGSNLKYIIINTVRRATVPKFNKAVLLVPFEWRDVLMVIMWIVLAISGFVFQHYHNRGRPPFPPPPRSVRPGRPEPTYGAIQHNNRYN
ncbi:unnamed protein product [Diatraea saccharalis]|uniref:TM7S3/TM198-like domain-containing protein n=1 Tax=Diatraea saccharalis TaxID=40085 RepID=A0A9N9N4E4_9NEOP|nr:unnamed protein product [Diatraea saccharalis]